MPGNSGPNLLPVLPLRNTVLFPRQAIPLSVGRAASIAAVEATLGSEDKTLTLVVASQQDPTLEAPRGEDLFHVGTRAVIKQKTQRDDAVEVCGN